MQLNPIKTQATIIGSKYNVNKINQNGQQIPKIKGSSIEIDYSETVKYLGFHFNNQFSPSIQIEQISKNGNFALSKIKHCRKSVNSELN